MRVTVRLFARLRDIAGAGELAVLAGLQRRVVSVGRRPTVAILSTGDELIDPEVVPHGGKIRDTNSILVRALVEQCGASIIAQARRGDDLAQIVSFAAEQPSHLLLISGGASVGEHDFGARALGVEYNAKMVEHVQRLRDFQLACYVRCGRQTPFWQHCAKAPLPGELEEKLELFRACGRVSMHECETFQEESWHALLAGSGLVPDSYDPLVDRMPEERQIHLFQEMLKFIAEQAEQIGQTRRVQRSRLTRCCSTSAVRCRYGRAAQPSTSSSISMSSVGCRSNHARMTSGSVGLRPTECSAVAVAASITSCRRRTSVTCRTSNRTSFQSKAICVNSSSG